MIDTMVTDYMKNQEAREDKNEEVEVERQPPRRKKLFQPSVTL